MKIQDLQALYPHMQKQSYCKQNLLKLIEDLMGVSIVLQVLVLVEGGP